MKINLDTVLVDMEKKPIKNGEKDLTLGSVISSALLAPYPNEEHLAGNEKFRRFKIAEKAYAGGEADITVEDVAVIKNLIAKAYTPLIVGRVYEIIE